MNNIILTGDRPTGHLHIGHYVGSLRERCRLQDSTQYEAYYVMIADAQALTDNAETPEKIRDNIINVMLDYLSVGLDPSKITFFLQSEVRALPELTMYYMNLVPYARVIRNPTVKNEVRLKNFASTPIGFINYPISQAADITAFKATLIPVGEDQEPMLEQTREIVRSFNRIYKTDCLVECKAVLSDNSASLRLPGIDGNEKMSKSLNNGIFLTDNRAVIERKINTIKTFPRKIEEPGIVEGNLLFTYLEAFSTPEKFKKYYSEFRDLDTLKHAYLLGGIGDIRIKKFLCDIIDDELGPIRSRRAEWESRGVTEIINILAEGTARANKAADTTLLEVKKAMKLDILGSN